MHSRLLIFFLFFSTLLKAQEIDVLHYSFRLELSDSSDSLKGLAQITFIHRDTGSFVRFDLKGPGKWGKGMTLRSVSAADGGVVPRCRQLPEQIEISTPNAKPGDTASLRIAYEGIPGDGLIISKNKFGDRTFFADNWPNRAHHWLPCKDSLDDKASFEFIVRAPAKYRVIANGIKVEESLEANNTRFTHWREDLALSTKVMVIGAARFAVTTYPDSPPHLPVTAWVYPQDSAKGVYDFAPATEIVRFFSDYISPFPYNKLANVQSTTIFGGMENASCIFYDENLVTGDRSGEETVAHEIAHQWFGDMVSEKSFAHLWLSEGFANYFTDLWIEKKYGQKAFRNRLQEAREKIIDFSGMTTHPVVDSTTDLMSLLNANSYEKGAWFLHMLRNEVGDETFQRIIRTYYNRYRGGNAETRDFEVVAEEVSGKDLKTFFDQWLYQPGIPVIKLKTYIEKDRLVFAVSQLQENSKQFPLEIEVTAMDGSRQRFVEMITEPKQVFSHVYGKKIKTVILDPDNKLLFEAVKSK